MLSSPMNGLGYGIAVKVNTPETPHTKVANEKHVGIDGSASNSVQHDSIRELGRGLDHRSNRVILGHCAEVDRRMISAV